MTLYYCRVSSRYGNCPSDRGQSTSEVSELFFDFTDTHEIYIRKLRIDSRRLEVQRWAVTEKRMTTP